MTPKTLAPDSLDAANVARLEQPRRVRKLRPPSFSVFGLLASVALLLQYKDLLYTLSQHRIRVRYKQSALGVTWAILQPASLMVIYTVIFSRIAKMPSNGIPYAVFAYTALLP